MAKRHSPITYLYDRIILQRPGIVILCVLAVVSFLGYKAKDFKLDASAETLILERDEDLRYSRLIESRYGQDDYLIIAFTPKNDLFSDETLEKLARLRNDLMQLQNVSSIVSILDAPLLQGPSLPLKALAANSLTLESPTTDRRLARTEFASSPLYQNLLVSPDLKTTALQIKFRTDPTYEALLARRYLLREKQIFEGLSPTERAEFKKVTEAVEKERDEKKKVRHRDIAAIREIMKKYRPDGELFLGGISMVADDLISFIKNDLKTFGLGVTFFLVITLSLIFRKKRWVLLPMLCCAASSISMMGLLGLFGWQVTVISSNFISLQLIITMAITIHLIVRYRELLFNDPGAEQRQLVLNTVRSMVTPCLYAELTTIAGFGSLVFCDILPVITFGWMMVAGVVVSFIMTFLLFPAGLMLLPKPVPHRRKESRFSLAPFLAGFTERHGPMILVTGCIAFVLSLMGIARLDVENSFIKYFKESTEIYQGMKVIDQRLGGTTPLDIVIEVDQSGRPAPVISPAKDAEVDDAFKDFDEFEKPEDDQKYWFTAEKMALAVKVHDYLDSLPETGKVLSLGTVIKIAEKRNNGKRLDSFQLAVLYNELPRRFKDILLKPYASPEHNELRFSIRVKDSEKTLRRNQLLKEIRHHLTGELGLKQENVHFAGLLVLYNNMLQSLFNSQILTLGIVVLALMAMFLVLFRSLKIAMIAIAPNLLAIGTVLGVMGWLGIPLDMMTITIAAISIGISVDNTIHYIYRFKREINADRNYLKTLHRCHGSIGHAMYYTSVTIIIGFSILVLSNFIPSILFGLLTGLAMLISLIAALTLLPRLLIAFKPFGPEGLRLSTRL